MSRSIRVELPSLAKEGWLRPLRKSREASLAGADGHERSECEPDRAKQGRVVRSSHRLSEVERTARSCCFALPGSRFAPRLSKEGAIYLMARPPLLCQGGEFL